MQMVNIVEGGERARMSKRKGDFVTLDELVGDIGVDAARFFMLQRSADTAIDIDLELARSAVAGQPRLLRPVRPCADREHPAQGGRRGRRRRRGRGRRRRGDRRGARRRQPSRASERLCAGCSSSQTRSRWPPSGAPRTASAPTQARPPPTSIPSIATAVSLAPTPSSRPPASAFASRPSERSPPPSACSESRRRSGCRRWARGRGAVRRRSASSSRLATGPHGSSGCSTRCARQTLARTEFEVIVVDDGSRDATSAVLAGADDGSDAARGRSRPNPEDRPRLAMRVGARPPRISSRSSTTIASRRRMARAGPCRRTGQIRARSSPGRRRHSPLRPTASARSLARATFPSPTSGSRAATSSIRVTCSRASTASTSASRKRWARTPTSAGARVSSAPNCTSSRWPPSITRWTRSAWLRRCAAR